MPGGWFSRERKRASGPGSDDVEERVARQAERAGRTAEDEQEKILREVLPNVRKTVAEVGLTMPEYLDLNRVEYGELLRTHPASRPLFGRRGGLVDYDSFLRLRRWIEAAAARDGVDRETWVSDQGRSLPRPARDRGTAAPPPASSVSGVPAPGSAPTNDVLDRLERLAALRDSGALTDDEFQEQKRRLLDEHR